MSRPRFVFVGAFSGAAHGGQRAACESLVNSDLSAHVDWILIENGSGVEAPSVARRARAAAGRVVAFARGLRDVDGALIFSSAGASFVEKGAMALLARGLRKRVVLAPRSGLLLDNLARSRFMRWYVPFVLRHCDVVICQGESWRTRFRALVGAEAPQWAVVPNWIAAGAASEPPAEPAPGAPVRCVYLGRLETYKGILDLVEAVALHRDALAGASFVIAGSGGAEAELRARIAAHGLADRFELLGWVDERETRALLRSAQVLVLPSHREGMPNAVLEGMAAGLAVVATAVGGVPDIVTSPALGRLVPPADPDALGAALAQLVRDPDTRRALGRAGQAHVRAAHQLDQAWPQVLALLDPTAARPGA